VCNEDGTRCIKNADSVPPFISAGMISQAPLRMLLIIQVDIFMDNKIDLSQQKGLPLLSETTWNAIVFVYSGPYGSIIPLSCKVNIHEVDSKSCEDMIIPSEIWEDINSSSEATSFHWEPTLWKRTVSYSIPSSSMPSPEKIQQWALNSLESEPSGAMDKLHKLGAMGKLHEEIFRISTRYVQCESRSLVSGEIFTKSRF
jgi:hypothetical protein